MKRTPFYGDTLLNDGKISNNFKISCDIDHPRETPLIIDFSGRCRTGVGTCSLTSESELNLSHNFKGP